MTVLEIPFAYFLQYFLFREEISRMGFVGTGLIVAATGLNLLRRLQLEKRSPTPPK